MNPDAVEKHLSELSTAWSVIDRTRAGTNDDDAAIAVAILVERYQSAVYRYLLAAVRDPNEADELFQEFALRLARGGFGKADPQKGRFRDYVKKALINLVANHRGKIKRRPERGPIQIEPVAPASGRFDSDAEFLLNWRQALLDRTWAALAADQSPTGAPLHSLLKLRTENPEWSAVQLAAQLTVAMKPTQAYSDVGVRKLLQRAREKFADLLVQEVACSMQKWSDEEIEEELSELGFQVHCQGAMERRRKRRAT